jgi:hypothetical protein
MCVENLVLLGLRELRDHRGCTPQGIVTLGEHLDEARTSFEELGELLAAQLPR